MLQAYSKNVAVTANSTIPLNNVTLKTGRTAVLEGSGTVALNCAGIYNVSFNAYGTSTADGTVGAKLQADGVDVAQAAVSSTATAGSVIPISFSTLVTVPNCTIKRLSIVYTGTTGTLDMASVVVTKLR